MIVREPCPVVVLYDDPTDVKLRSDGTDSHFEMMSITSVETISKAVVELGFPEPDVVSCKELLELITGNGVASFQLALNLSSGIVDRWRYAQGPMALEILRLPYSGSSLFSILICRDKYRCKYLCKEAAKIPASIFVNRDRLDMVNSIRSEMFPAILKPNSEGGSVGVGEDTVVTDHKAARECCEMLLASYPEGILIEKFIPGIEVTAVVLGNEGERRVYPFSLAKEDKSALPTDFIRTQKEKADAFITGDRTWFDLSETHSIDVCQSVTESAKRIADALDLKDLSRLDFRLDESGDPYFLEANAQPTFVPGNTSLSRCNELVFRDPLGVEKNYITAAMLRTGLAH